MIGVIFILIWLVSNRIAKILCDRYKEGFIYIQKWYYWFQFILFGIAILLTPKYSVNEALFFLIIYISLKVVVDRLKFIDSLIKNNIP